MQKVNPHGKGSRAGSILAVQQQTIYAVLSTRHKLISENKSPAHAAKIVAKPLGRSVVVVRDIMTEWDDTQTVKVSGPHGRPSN